ncbi:hypothetical protein GIB67_027305 [Kingdonia uniflora]|uniref:Pentatricopeptide repeat-containing protein n=1 Tax=Kingdonia uniflora TaxID=39325 RepID=A0A7J7KYJ1_9MAGN|nr:hypothetical protein GIB67_027305 [Kingdonia uniflora]
MILQTSISSSLQQQPNISPSTLLSRRTPPSILHLPNRNPNDNSIITCSISQVHCYGGTIDYEKKSPLKWSSLYRRISLMENPDLGSSSVLNMWNKEGRKLSKWELCRVVRELRKYRRYKLALQVYQWMSDQRDKFTLYSSDIAIQLDLIAKVYGISAAEEYFLGLPDASKDKRTYGALLNAYVQAKMTEKAESLLIEMRKKSYDTHPLPFNVMMTLYMKLKEYEKVISMVSEMMEKNVPLDLYSYNIWLTTCGAMGSAANMEEVLERMKEDSTVNPNWSTYSTMASMYMKLGLAGKAEHCLKMVEGRITGRDRIPYHYLLSLYGNIGKKEEIYRIWNTYKSSFPNVPNLAYHSMIAALVRLDDIGGAEQIYEEWLTVKPTFDPRIYNLLMGWYVRNGMLQKAEALLDQVFEGGGQANSISYEILAEGHIKVKQIPEALSCMKEALTAERAKDWHWKPNPSIVSDILLLCEQKTDRDSKDALMELLKQVGCLEDENYMSLIVTNDLGPKLSVEKDSTDDDGADMLLNQLQGGL